MNAASQTATYVSHPYEMDTPVAVGSKMRRMNGQPTKITVTDITTVASGERIDGMGGPYTFRESHWYVLHLSNGRKIMAPPNVVA